MRKRDLSLQLFKKSLALMPGGVNSPVRAFSSLGITPLVVERAEADEIIDVDGNSYIDFCCSWGSLILGHSPPVLMKKIEKALYRGTSYGALSSIEIAYAEALLQVLPHLDRIRFVSSGTEATMTALRLSRGYTGKNKIVKFNGNYHGHVDNLLIKAGSGVGMLKESSSLGIPKEAIQHVISLTYNSVEEFVHYMEHNEDVAAVIFEPVAGNMGVIPASSEFLIALREMTRKKGALLIVDEVITGFRLGLQGACGHFLIEPDLVCYGKIIGGGFPVAAFGGKKEIMEKLAPQGGVYQAGTLSGNPLAMQAGFETLQVLKEPSFYNDLQDTIDRFLAPIEALIQERNLPIVLAKVKTMFSFFFDVAKVENDCDLKNISQEKFKAFFQRLFDRGIFLSPSAHEACFISSAHTEEHLRTAQEEILSALEMLYSKSAIFSSERCASVLTSN